MGAASDVSSVLGGGGAGSKNPNFASQLFGKFMA
jgi:hypothetical protein